MFEWKKNSGWIVGLFLIGLLIYSFNLNNELFWDDDDWIINNPNVHSLSGENIKNIFTKDILSGFGLNSNYYRPLLLLSFVFNWVLHGSSPVGYHIISNLFHVANAILIFLLLSIPRLNPGRIQGLTLYSKLAMSKRASFIAALLWLVHPLNVEAVAYISGRGDPMSVFFILLALLFFLKSKGSTLRILKVEPWKTLSLVSMILAVLSRETAILFPALVMVFYIAFLTKHRFWKAFREAFMKTISFWAVSVVYFILRLTVLNFKNTLNFYSQANLYTEHLSYRLYTFGHALVEYFKLIFVPLGLHMERELPVNTSLFQYPVWLGAVLVLMIIVVGIVLYRREISKSESLNPKQYQNQKSQNLEIRNSRLEIKQPNSFRIWLFSWGWFFIAIAPVSGIIPINALIYEHWLYLPFIGLATLAGFYLDKFLSVLKVKKLTTYYFLLTTLFIVYISFLGILTIKRNIAWGNQITFYEDILKYNPNTVRIINNLGNAYGAKGNLIKATEMYERAIALPDGQEFAQPYYNLANTYRDQNKPKEAAEMYMKAIEVDPNFPFAYKNLTVLYAKYGFFSEAIQVLREFQKIWPGDPLIDEAIKRLTEDLEKN